MEKSPMRNIPQQTRSLQRVDLILDTAARLLAEVGYESITTNAIAEQAGISIGSLYRYFPDKEAILKALVNRHLKELHQVYDQIFNKDLIYLPLPVVLDRVLDPFVEMHVKFPAYKHLLLGADVSPDIAAASEALEDEILERLVYFFQRAVPHIGEERAHLVALVCKAEVKALLSLLETSSDGELQAQIVAEVKRMLHAYLEPLFGEAHAG
jgi:AcrR family transcriptional regulator